MYLEPSESVFRTSGCRLIGPLEAIAARDECTARTDEREWLGFRRLVVVLELAALADTTGSSRSKIRVISTTFKRWERSESHVKWTTHLVIVDLCTRDKDGIRVVFIHLDCFRG